MLERLLRLLPRVTTTTSFCTDPAASHSARARRPSSFLPPPNIGVRWLQRGDGRAAVFPFLHTYSVPFTLPLSYPLSICLSVCLILVSGGALTNFLPPVSACGILIRS
jgi:hypothetical protein